MKFHWDIIQGTDEWNQLRCGRITASVVKTLLINGKGEGGFGTGAITELYRVVEEKLTNTPREGFGGNWATEWGHENEELAIELYENLTFYSVDRIGFIERDEFTGASPDGLIPEIRKGLEVKCRPKNHLELVLKNEYLKDDYTQCQYGLWCSGYDSWDLMYFHPNLTGKAQYKIFEFEPDKKMFGLFEERIDSFSNLADKIIKSLQ